MSDEVEAFLRRAAAQRRDRRAVPEVEIIEPAGQVLEAEIVEAQPLSRELRPLHQDKPARQQQDLVDAPGLGGDLMAIPIDEHFEHPQSQPIDWESVHKDQADAYGDQARPLGVSPHAIAQLLHTPQTMRQAIILNEVLTRPEHRW